MKKLLLALICIAAPVFAAELPALEEGFPDKWEKVAETKCSPKEGVVLNNIVYARPTNDGALRAIMLTEKNGVRILQSKMHLVMVAGQPTPIGIITEVLLNDKVVTIGISAGDDQQKVENATEQLKGTVLSALGLTAEEYAKCNK